MLLEWIPVTIKNIVVKVIARSIKGDVILLKYLGDTQPAEIKGMRIREFQHRDVDRKKGPISVSIMLLDKIGRLTPFAFQHRLLILREKESSGINPYRIDRTGAL
jgi:hypothetical protein